MGRIAGTGGTGKEAMFTHFKRVLMSAVDAGTGSGGNSAPAPIPVETPANVSQAQGTAVTMTQDQLAVTVAAAAAKAVADAKDSIFAEARRTFTDSKKSKAKTDDTPETPAALTATEERTLLRGGDRAISQLGIKLNDAQYQRFERDLLADRPSDVVAYAKSYFDGFGPAPAPAPATPAPTAQQAPAPAQPVNANPASNRGAPPASTTSLEMSEFARWPEADRLAFLKEKGPVEYRKAVNGSLRGRPVKLR